MDLVDGDRSQVLLQLFFVGNLPEVVVVELVDLEQSVLVVQVGAAVQGLEHVAVVKLFVIFVFGPADDAA